MIQQKPIHTAPPQLQCMLLHIQKSDYTIQYKPNKTMVLAGCLGCFPSHKESLSIPIDQNIQRYWHTIVHIRAGCHLRKHQMWPSVQHTVPHHPQGMAKLPEAGPENHLILLEHLEWAVPGSWYSPEGEPSLHSPRTLWLHPCWPPQSTPGDGEDASTGEGSSLLARHQCWHCQLCMQVHHIHKASPPAQPVLPWDIPNGPWQEFAVGYFHHKGKEYLLIYNLFSKYPFLSKVSSKSVYSLSQKLQELISQYGPPSLIYKDNGPPFASEEFVQFLQWQLIDHITPSPHFPWSNSFIKCQVKTLKTTLSTTQDAGRLLEDLLLDLFCNPISPNMPLSYEILHNWTIQCPGKSSTLVHMECIQD